MRPCEKRDERTDAAAQAEDGVPLKPGLLLLDEILKRPAEVTDDPQPETDGNGIPEQPVTTSPDPPSAQDGGQDRERGNQESDVAENRQRERVIPEEPADGGIHQDVTNAEGQIHQEDPECRGQ